jgi:Tfp pilus assembly protein PilF
MAIRHLQIMVMALAVASVCISIASTQPALSADIPLSLKLTSRGYSLLQAGSPSAATNVLTQALIADPRNIAARRLLARADYLCGRSAECVQQLQMIQSVEPNMPSDLVLLGRAYVSLRKTAEACSLFHRVLQVDPNNAEALLGMIDIHLAQGQYQAASSLCKRILATASSTAAIEDATQKLSLIEQCSQKSEHHPG